MHDGQAEDQGPQADKSIEKLPFCEKPLLAVERACF